MVGQVAKLRGICNIKNDVGAGGGGGVGWGGVAIMVGVSRDSRRTPTTCRGPYVWNHHVNFTNNTKDHTNWRDMAQSLAHMSGTKILSDPVSY